MVVEKKELAEVLKAFPIEKIKQKLDENNSQIEYLLNFSFKEFVVLSQNLKEYYSNLKEYFDAKKGEILDLEKYHTFLKSINQLIIDLQFHDIIRQKLEHIKTAQEFTIDEIKSLQPGTKLDNTSYVYIIPEISLLHAQQLDVLRGEYKFATDGIKDALTEILHVGKTYDATLFYVTDTVKHAQEFSRVVDQLARDLDLLCVPYEKGKKLEITEVTLVKLTAIEKLYTMKSERDVFNSIFKGIEIEQADPEEDIELF